MAALQQAGVGFRGIEAHRQVGGIWDQSNPLSSVYDGMQTNTSRQTTHLGRAMPATWPHYPSSGQAHSYLISFAEQEQLPQHIEFSTRFERAKKTPQGIWRVTLRRGTAAATVDIECRAIVFATGVHHREHCVVPRELWDEAVSAGLDVRHSSCYRSAEEYAGQRVLIVGIGNSGSDIADRVSRTADRTVLAVRSTPWIVPSMVFGRPSDQLADESTSWLPYWVQLASFHFIQRLYIGHPRKLGLDTPRSNLLERLSVTDRGFLKAIREGRIALRSNVVSLAGGVATFAKAGQPPEKFDAVIFATGYNRQYPLLDTSLGNGLAEALSFLVFHRREPGLVYMAETIGTRGCWPIFTEQGRAMAAYFAAEQRGGRNVAAFNIRRALPSPDFKGKMFRTVDGFHVDYHRYMRALRDLTRWLSE
jgi:cation diffusion facilitator CzcD-associated flavoprotein CzcO